MQLNTTQPNIKSNSPDSDNSPMPHVKLKLSLAELKSHYTSNVKKKGPFSVCTRTFLTSGADISSKIATTTSGTTLFTSFKSAAISLTEKLLGRVGFTTLCKPFWYGAITEIIPRSQRGESIFEWFDRETLPELYERKSNYQLTQSEIYEKLGSATINVRAHKLLIDKCLAKVFYVKIFMGGVAVPFGLSNYKGFNT